MVQELISKTVAIIGAGPAGCICAKILQDCGIIPTIFEKNSPLLTLLPTGGGRCNLANSEFNFIELAKNYPRGEKFLYSIFSKFATADTIEFFNSIDIKTYTQEDNRIFPVSNSAKKVRENFLKSISHCKIIKESVLEIQKLNNCYKIKTNKASYAYDIIVVAIGGHGNFNIMSKLNVEITPPTQALVGLLTKEKFSTIAGIQLKDIFCNGQHGDMLFTHKGVSGPLIYKISSINARKTFPYKISLKLVDEFDIQKELNENSKKSIKNLLAKYLPKNFANYFLENLQIPPDTYCHQINGKTRDKIYSNLINYEIEILGKVPDGEVVTCGGIALNQVNPKTLELKTLENLYCCGEVIDVDGFCGGFNLQNCWSTGFIVATSINKKLRN